MRLPVLLLGQIAGPFSDFWLLYPAPMAAAVYVVALLSVAVGAAILWPLWRRSAVTRFWTLGAVTAGVPICATFPSDRLLVFVGIGAMGAIASLLALDIDSERPLDVVRRVTTRIVAVSLALLHLIVAPLLLPLRSLTVAQLARVVEGAAQSLPNTDQLRDKVLVVVSAPSDGLVAYAPILRAAQGLPWPKHLRLLATGVGEMRVTRLDAFTLRVRPAAGFYGSEIERMVRGLSEPMAPGYRVTLSDMQVTVTAVTADGRAAEAEFRFALPLEDPSLLWTRWEGGALVAYDPPQPGQTQIIPAGDLAAALLGRKS